jgi:hypothetical protein
MTTGTQKASRQSTVVRTGTVLGLAYSPELINNVGKEPQESAQITRWGIPGDRHYGETRYSNSARKTVANNRPITILGVEATRSATEALGIPELPVGGMGENLLLEGMGDLGDLVKDDEVHVLDENGEPKVILSVRKQNEPCSNLQVYHKMMTKQMMGKRGVICTVLKEGSVQKGDRVALVRR